MVNPTELFALHSAGETRTSADPWQRTRTFNEVCRKNIFRAVDFFLSSQLEDYFACFSITLESKYEHKFHADETSYRMGKNGVEIEF